MTSSPRDREPLSRAAGPCPAILAVLLLALSVSDQAAAATTLVVCAPGYPGSTAEAQPAMDAFAAAAGAAASWAAGDLQAVYFETEAAGIERLRRDDATLALVPLPFFLAHEGELRLVPRAQAVVAGGQASEPWTLVAAAGRLPAAAALQGFEVVSLSGYVPRFVRGPALGSWGELPPGLKVGFSGAVLSALRRAAAGEAIAVLLDGPQAAALPSLPFAARLEVAHRSPPLPVSVLCTVGSRLPAERAAGLVRALLSLGGSAGGAAALAGLRLDRFVAPDAVALDAARAAFARAPE